MVMETMQKEKLSYDDKMVITFNYKEGTKTITFAELQEAISNKNGSDLDCLAAPIQKPSWFLDFLLCKRLRKQNLQTSRSFRIDLPHGIIYNWIAYHLRCDQRHVAHHPIDKGGFIP